MTRQTSLGDLITALYDAARSDKDESDHGAADSLVALCTVDLLLRQRKPSALAQLLGELPS